MAFLARGARVGVHGVHGVGGVGGGVGVGGVGGVHGVGRVLGGAHAHAHARAHIHAHARVVHVHAPPRVRARGHAHAHTHAHALAAAHPNALLGLGGRFTAAAASAAACRPVHPPHALSLRCSRRAFVSSSSRAKPDDDDAAASSSSISDDDGEDASASATLPGAKRKNASSSSSKTRTTTKKSPRTTTKKSSRTTTKKAVAATLAEVSEVAERDAPEDVEEHGGEDDDDEEEGREVLSARDVGDAEAAAVKSAVRVWARHRRRARRVWHVLPLEVNGRRVTAAVRTSARDGDSDSDGDGDGVGSVGVVGGGGGEEDVDADTAGALVRIAEVLADKMLVGANTSRGRRRVSRATAASVARAVAEASAALEDSGGEKPRMPGMPVVRFDSSWVYLPETRVKPTAWKAIVNNRSLSPVRDDEAFLPPAVSLLGPHAQISPPAFDAELSFEISPPRGYCSDPKAAEETCFPIFFRTRKPRRRRRPAAQREESPPTACVRKRVWDAGLPLGSDAPAQAIFAAYYPASLVGFSSLAEYRHLKTRRFFAEFPHGVTQDVKVADVLTAHIPLPFHVLCFIDPIPTIPSAQWGALLSICFRSPNGFWEVSWSSSYREIVGAPDMAAQIFRNIDMAFTAGNPPPHRDENDLVGL